MDFKNIIDWIKDFKNQIQKCNNLLYMDNKNHIPVSMTDKLRKLLNKYNNFKKDFITLYKKLNDQKYTVLKHKEINIIFENFEKQIDLIRNNNYAEKPVLQIIKKIDKSCELFIKMYVKQYDLEINFN